MESRIRVTYQLHPPEGQSLEEYARDVAVEETVEVPEACIPPELEERVVGRVEELAATAGRGLAVISYSPDLVGDDVPQLLNLLYGNASLYPGIRVVGLEIPEPTLQAFGGPGVGIRGIRSMTGVKGRALLCTPAKPLGLSSSELAERCGAMARGGADLVKDDHSITDQPPAPFAERVRRCQAAVQEANAATGGNALYLPNVTTDRARMPERLELIRSLGCRGVLLNSVAVGLDAVAWIGREFGLAVVSHLTMTGVFFAPDRGIAPPVFYGKLMRLLSADGVIFPNPGTRFPLAREECVEVHDNLTRPWGGLRRAFPMAGGGVSADSVARWAGIYGPDTIFLVGGSVLEEPDLEVAVARVRGALEG